MTIPSSLVDAGDHDLYACVDHRDHFDKPLSHLHMFRGICRARGRRYFEVGEVPHGDSEEATKLRSIGFLKRGFTSRSTHGFILTLPAEAKGDPCHQENTGVREAPVTAFARAHVGL